MCMSVNVCVCLCVCVSLCVSVCLYVCLYDVCLCLIMLLSISVSIFTTDMSLESLNSAQCRLVFIYDALSVCVLVHPCLLVWLSALIIL